MHFVDMGGTSLGDVQEVVGMKTMEQAGVLR